MVNKEISESGKRNGKRKLVFICVENRRSGIINFVNSQSKFHSWMDVDFTAVKQ